MSATKGEKSFSPPAGVRSAAKRALQLIKDGRAGSGFTDVGRARAAQLASGQSVSRDTIKRMNSYFARHKGDKKPGWGKKGEETPGYVAWLAWGGDAGAAWARKMVRSFEAEASLQEETMSDIDLTAEDVAAFAPTNFADDDRLDEEELPTDEEILEENDEDTDEYALPDRIPWKGILAPENIRSGDGRKFSTGALTHRNLPLPLRWQEADTGGHNGAITVGTIDNIWRDGDMMWGSGTFLDTQEADTVVGQIMEGALRGVSIDADDAEMAAESDDGEVEFSKARICAATLVAIPAFAEAYVELGEPEGVVACGEFKDYTPEERRGMAEKGEAMEDGSYPIADCEDLRNAIQAIGRASDPDAVKVHIKKRKDALGCDEVDLPEQWAVVASAEFKRGAGWVTHPEETRTLHRYWTKGKGAAKIRWGTPGDFRRLRRALAKYISPAYLNRTAAQWHKDALGYWPGECGKPGNPKCGEKRSADVVTASAVNLVAAAQDMLPFAAFQQPALEGPTAITVEGDRVFGHLALFGVCHIGIQNACTTAPRSEHDYAFFRTGAVLTDQGTVSVGQLTMGTGHADLHANAAQTAAHYDHTGTVVADVAVGEDEFGIWFSGMLRPGLSQEQVRAFMAGALSGDWRRIGGSLELVAALVVNVPGFPVPRPSLAASLVGQESLVAAGVVEGVVGDDVDDLLDRLMARLDERAENKLSRELMVSDLQREMRLARVDSVRGKVGQ